MGQLFGKIRKWDQNNFLENITIVVFNYNIESIFIPN